MVDTLLREFQNPLKGPPAYLLTSNFQHLAKVNDSRRPLYSQCMNFHFQSKESVVESSSAQKETSFTHCLEPGPALVLHLVPVLPGSRLLSTEAINL